MAAACHDRGVTAQGSYGTTETTRRSVIYNNRTQLSHRPFCRQNVSLWMCYCSLQNWLQWQPREINKMCLCLKVCKFSLKSYQPWSGRSKFHETLNSNCPFPHTAINRSPSKALPTPQHILQKRIFHKLPTPSYNNFHALLTQKLSIIQRWTTWTTDKRKMLYLVHLELQLYGSFNFLHETHTFIPQPSKWQHTRTYLHTI